MSPKEKAIELHNKILNITYDDRDIPDEPTWVSTKCAIVAVDEIIEALENNAANSASWLYYEEVKQEIQNL